MKRLRDLSVFLFFSLAITIIIVGSLYNYYLSPVSHISKRQAVTILKGQDINKVATILYNKKIIRNHKVFVIYLKIYNVSKIKEGTYILNQNMGSKKIAEILIADK